MHFHSFQLDIELSKINGTEGASQEGGENAKASILAQSYLESFVTSESVELLSVIVGEDVLKAIWDELVSH